MQATDPLRTKLKALVGELHQQAAIYRRGQEVSDERQALAYTQCARKLAALLAESEPERDECPFPSPEHRGESGCPCNPIDGKCVYCGAPEPELLAAPTTDCEAKAKLPLGHEFVAAVDSLGRASKSSADFCGECGQPRSAHEPR